jgi:fatty acid desaturase
MSNDNMPSHGLQPPGKHHANFMPPKGSAYAVMGTWSYIGSIFLFCIPVIGWLFCIVMAYEAKNVNRRCLARATLVFIAVGLVILAALCVVGGWIMQAVWQYVGDATNGFITGMADLPKLRAMLSLMNAAR